MEQPDVFIAGGHGGMVSAFGIHDIVRTYEEDEDEYDFIEPLMSFKAHSGWVHISTYAISKPVQTRLH